MPIATYKIYQCPQCKSKTTIYQGDVITSFSTCKNCKCLMELVGDEPKNMFTFIKNIFTK